MSFKNTLIKAIISLSNTLSKKSRSSDDSRKGRFLIVSTTGLGDTLWATPAIKALRSTYPAAYIAVVTSGIGKEVLKYNPHIDELFVVKQPALFSLIPLLFKLRKKKIGTVLIFHTSQRPMLPFCHFVGAAEIIGTKKINKGLDFILTRGLEQAPIHEIARRLKIVAEVGAASPDPSLELYFDEADEWEMIHFLEKHRIPNFVPIVGIHPGAKDRFKQWDPKHFIEVGELLMQHLGCQVIVTGSSDERELVEKVAAGIKGAIPICGQLPLRSLAALIQRMNLMISNDTGPMHIAFAVKTPTVALFSPTDPKLCGPLFFRNAIVIEKPRPCTPCLRKKCKEPFCLLQISPKEVYDAALKLFYTLHAAKEIL